jgi:hypothetical protein
LFECLDSKIFGLSDPLIGTILTEFWNWHLLTDFGKFKAHFNQLNSGFAAFSAELRRIWFSFDRGNHAQSRAIVFAEVF